MQPMQSVSSGKGAETGTTARHEGRSPHGKNTGRPYRSPPAVCRIRVICTCICAFTKYVVAWPIRNKKATTVAKGLVENVILRLGTPYTVLTCLLYTSPS